MTSFVDDADYLGRHLRLDEVPILEALAALRNSGDPSADVLNRSRLMQGGIHVIAAGEAIARFIGKYGLAVGNPASAGSSDN